MARELSLAPIAADERGTANLVEIRIGDALDRVRTFRARLRAPIALGGLAERFGQVSK